MHGGIAYLSHAERPIDAAQVRRLYDGAGWWPGRPVDGIQECIDFSDISIGAWDGDHLAGYVRALTDGKYRAYVEDVVVDPAYRGRGIGEAMVAELVKALAGIETVSLFCEPERVPFYERNGFKRNATQVMMHRGPADPS
jgi:ribosomal protein S18 acetylase RimI-like enzyme